MLIAAMQELDVTGVTGEMTWDATGAVTKTPRVVRIENRHLRQRRISRYTPARLRFPGPGFAGF